MSAVVEVNTLDQPRDNLFKFSFDRYLRTFFLNKSINRKVNYYFSGRRSNFDISNPFKIGGSIDPFTQSQIRRRYGAVNVITPKFHDVWNKLEYRLNLKHKVSLNILFTSDKFFFVHGITYFRTEFTDTSRKNLHSWINWNWLINKYIYSVTTLGYQDLSKRARFTFDLNLRDGNVDNSNVGIFTLKQKNIWQGLANHTFEYGFEFNKFSADYLFDDVRLNRLQTTENNPVVDTIFVDKNIKTFRAAFDRIKRDIMSAKIGSMIKVEFKIVSQP